MRKVRLIKKCLSLNWLLVLCSHKIKKVIKNPLNTKKKLTPSAPFEINTFTNLSLLFMSYKPNISL